VPEGEVDRSIRLGCSGAKRFQVLEIAAKHFGSGGLEGVGSRIAARKPEHLMARADEFPNAG
jgi:hypothetical protein